MADDRGPSRLEVVREAEWRMAKKNPYDGFLTKFHRVPIVGHGYEVMSSRDYQREWINHVHEQVDDSYTILLKSRQIGATTIFSGYALQDALFNPYHEWINISTNEDEAQETLSTKIKQPYSLLPKWFRDRAPKVTKETEDRIAFDNGSSITSLPSTSKAGRGRAVFGVMIDEAAFIENADEIFAALDPMCYGPIIIFSTANGMGNWYQETWAEAEQPETPWVPFFESWEKVPIRADRPDELRDDDWYHRQALKFRKTPHLLYQEHPRNPQEAFAKSGRHALLMEALTEMETWQEPAHRYDMVQLAAAGFEDMEKAAEDAEIHGNEWADIELHVWELPYIERGPDGLLFREPNFTVGVDVSEGLEDGDYTAISVFDVNTWEQVATVRAHVPLEMIGPIAEWVSYWYFTALLAVERNNMGVAPLQYLQDVSYPRLLRMDTLAQIKRGDRTPRYGWYTTKASKPKMVADFNKDLRVDSLGLYDRRLLGEAGTFLTDGKGGFGASSGNHDDLVMATMISRSAADEVGAYPIIWEDPEDTPLTFGEVFAVAYAGQEEEHPLARGIGQSKVGPHVVKSFEMRQS
jgi:hypothetical protein